MPLPKAAEADAVALVPMPTATAPAPVASGAAPDGGPQTGQFSPTWSVVGAGDGGGVGSDVGGWIRDFRKAMKEAPVEDEEIAAEDANRVIEGEAHLAEDSNRVIDGEAHAEKEKV